MVLITFFYYQNEQRLYTDLTKSNMQNIASDISSKIVFTHMTGRKFDKYDLLNEEHYKLSFYDDKKEMIYGNIKRKIDFTNSFVKHNNHFIFIDKSPLGHLGIYYIVIEEHLLSKQLNDLKFNIFFFFIVVYFIIALIGFYLAKLFLKPIKEEREKLNNFVKDTTHELNTPITALLMSTETDILSPKQIERIKLSARKISEIYKDLTYIILEEHADKKETVSIPVHDIIKEQLNYFEPFFVKKHIQLTVDISDFNYSIDTNDFIRLFNNIISNAIKYNNMGGEIKICLNQIGKLVITDTGIGIEKHKIKDIFNRYFRATTEQGGFGIGLNIVRHICLEYNIEIDVQSTYKTGTSFTFTFPINVK